MLTACSLPSAVASEAAVARDPSSAPAATASPEVPQADVGPLAGVEFTAVAGAEPGGTAMVTIRTARPASCSIRYVTPAGTVSEAQGLAAKPADAAGQVSWHWKIGTRTHPGTGRVTVTCGAATATTPISIG